MIYVEIEFSFDKQNKNYNQIYRIISERKTATGTKFDLTSPPPLAQAIKNDFPGIKGARFLNMDNPSPLISYDQKKFYEKKLYFADADVFEIFSIPFINGDARTALQNPNSVVITQDMAEKYFGDVNAVDKTITLNSNINLVVTGVIKNLPANSSLQFDFLVSFSTLNGWLGKDFVENWQNFMCQTYILLPEKYNAASFEPGLKSFFNKYFDKSSSLVQIKLQPLSRVHLYTSRDFSLTSAGDINTIYILIAAAMFVLLIACFNFINLTTAGYLQRAKEVSVRKLIGASRKQLIQQFLIEGMLITIIALIMAVVAAFLLAPSFSAISGNKQNINLIDVWEYLLIPFCVIICSGLAASLFPAFYLTSFSPIQSLKLKSRNGNKKITFRKTLVITQFALTIMLIIGTVVVFKQLDYLRNKNLGFAGDQIIVAPLRDEELRKNPEALKNVLMQQPGILKTGTASLLPGGPVGKTRYRVQGSDNIGTMSMLWVDHDFISTLGIKMIAGRDFSKEFTTDESEGFIINEEAVKQLGLKKPEDAVGKSFELVGNKKGKIIGVVIDFHFSSLHRIIEPVVLYIWPFSNYVLIRFDSNKTGAVINELKNVWNVFDPAHPFEFNFLNGNFQQSYQSEKQLGNISVIFSLLAVILAGMGLFSLAALIIKGRIKEIGIRKVLGAPLISVLGLQLKEFVVMVIMANIIAWTFSYYLMNKWLQDFAYRTELSLWIFILSGGIALVITLLTVSYHAVKAATSDPIKSIRYE